MGEKFSGNRRMRSLYETQFMGNQWLSQAYILTWKVSAKKKSICKLTLNEQQLSGFKAAIDKGYVFEMFVGNTYYRYILAPESNLAFFDFRSLVIPNILKMILSSATWLAI